MTEEAVAVQPNEAELMAQMNEAVASGDFKQVAKIASEIAKVQKTKEQAELDAKQEALIEVTDKVKTAIQKALKPIYEGGQLDVADGVFFNWDFGEQLVACRLTKSAPRRKAGGGGGGGKKFSISTNELLDKHGAEEYKDGSTYKQAYDSNTDKNWRYAIRESLLKKDGLIS